MKRTRYKQSRYYFADPLDTLALILGFSALAFCAGFAYAAFVFGV